jgi:benzodiazapine receptor
MTPDGYAFSIWTVIFLSELVWAIFQLLPSFRSSDMVINGVGWYFVWICRAQINCLDGLYFTMQEILLSLIAMISILIPLVIVPLRMAKIKTEDNTTYAILKFPFEIHAAWIMAASLVNANVLLVDLELSKTIQIKSLLPSSR